MKLLKNHLLAISLLLPTLGIGFSLSSCEDSDASATDSEDEIVVNNYLLTATGQTTLYDNDGAVVSSLSVDNALYGQDANTLKGAAMAYRDNGDGTITDLNTGLMWQSVPDPDDFTWQEAADYCENLELGGYDDWRMPSCKELYSISDFGTGWPYIDTTYFKLASGEVTKDEQYWSINKYVGVTVEGQDNAAFGVNHVTGHIKAYAAGDIDMSTNIDANTPPATTTPPQGGMGEQPMGNPFGKQIRAVRGDTYGVNNYANNNDGTITDQATGLMWAQDDSQEPMDWQAALTYAKNAELAGYTDWRLPNVKELQSIVDYSYSPSATDASKTGPAIDPIFTCTPITNEAGNSDYGYFWTSTSANFTSGEPYYYAWYVAFGMAVDGDGLDFHGAGAVRFDTKYEGGNLGEGGERYYNFVRLVRDAD